MLLLKRTRVNKMAIELPEEIVPRINEIKNAINVLDEQGAVIQKELDDIAEAGVEIKVRIKSIEDIDANVEMMKQQFHGVVADREVKLEKILEEIRILKKEMADIVTEALLG